MKTLYEVKIPYTQKLRDYRDVEFTVSGVRCVSLSEIEEGETGLPFEVRICHAHAEGDRAEQEKHKQKIMGGDEVQRFPDERSARKYFRAFARTLGGHKQLAEVKFGELPPRDEDEDDE